MMISVIIPNFNDLRIIRTLSSILNQTYKEFEIIVVDGGSTNSELLKTYKKFPITHLIHEKDKGIFDALNKGIKLAKSEIVYLLGSDDYLPSCSVFELIISDFNKSPRLDGVCIGCEFIDSNGNVIRKWYPNSISAKKFKIGIFPPHFSLFLKRELYDLVGKFKYLEHKNIACDIIWLLDLAILKPDLFIHVEKRQKVFMEYGGASTGSFSAVLKQFVTVHSYAKQCSSKLPCWFLLSITRTFSKVFQFTVKILPSYKK